MGKHNGITFLARVAASLFLLAAASAHAQHAAVASFPGPASVAAGESMLVDVGFNNTMATPAAGVNFVIDLTNVGFNSIATPAVCMGTVTPLSATQLQVTGASAPPLGNCVMQIELQGVAGGSGTVAIAAGGQISTGATASVMVNNVPATAVTSTAIFGPNTLKSVIAYVNAHCTGSDTITFNIPGAGPHTIAPSGGFFFPAMTCSNAAIDGYTQPSAAANSDAGLSNNASVQIILNGAGCGAGCNGITLSAPNTVVRGLAIHSFPAYGIYADSGATAARIEGNYIGTDPGGMSAFPNGTSGVHAGAQDMVVGGPAASARNLITGNSPNGVEIYQGNVTVQNNQLGGNRSGAATFGHSGAGLISNANSGWIQDNYITGNGTGVLIQSSYNFVVSNRIQGNTFHGIQIASGLENELSQNLSYNNGGLGIALGAGGTPNDEATIPYDADTGPNDLLNHPVITAAYQAGATTTIVGTLKTVFGSVRIEFFSNASMPALPQGSVYIGATNIALDGNGFGTFNATFSGLHDNLTATATVDTCMDGCNVSSEYSSAVAVGPAPPATGTLTPASLTFAATQTGQVSASQTVTLTNTGSVDIAIGNINVSGPFQFAAGGTCVVGSPVPAGGGTCIIDVSFAPMAAGVATGQVIVTSNAGTLSSSLSGTGTSAPIAAIVADPAKVDFGSQAPGTVSADRIVTIQNAGNATLTISNMQATDPFQLTLGASMPSAADAAPVPKAGPMISFPCPGGSFNLFPGQACTLIVRFAPTTSGNHNGAVIILSNVAPFLVNLTGSAGSGKSLAVDPAAISFGAVNFGRTSESRSFTLSNAGFAEIAIGEVKVIASSSAPTASAEAADFMLTHDCLTLAPRSAQNSATSAPSSCTATVKFKPGAVGPRAAVVQVSGDFEGGMLRVPLEGTGTPSPVPLLAFSATRFGFGQTVLGISQAQSFTITNGGQLPVALGNIYTMGEFFVRHDCPSMLAVGASCGITTGFSPVVPGARQGVLVIESNAEGSPHRLPLEGSACRAFTPRGARLGLTTCAN